MGPHYIWKNDRKREKRWDFRGNWKLFLTPFEKEGILCHAPLRTEGPLKVYCAVLQKRRAVSSKRRPESVLKMGPVWTQLKQEVSQAWLQNVPISPRSSMDRRSTASARGWLPPTAARFWLAAAPRAAPAFPTEHGARETLEQRLQGRLEFLGFLRP